MKILHTADWHLGKRLAHFSRFEEQKAVLDEICNIADEQQVDAVLIAGDLYDTFNPPNEAEELLYRTLHRLAKGGKRAVVAIAGNHDSADKVQAPRPLANECGIVFAGYPFTELKPFALETGLALTHTAPGFIELQLPGLAFPLRILLTPYANGARMRTFFEGDDKEQALREALAKHWQQLADQFCDEQGVNVLMAHLFMVKREGERPEEPEDERAINHVGGAQEVYSDDLPKQLQYTALGHLHRFQNVAAKTVAPAIYSGSLLEYSFSEQHQQKYVNVVELQPGQPAQMERIPLQTGKKLHKQKFSTIGEASEWLEAHPDTFVELYLKTEQFLDGQQRKALHQLHAGIVNIIPEFSGSQTENEHSTQLDLSAGIETLFAQYFTSKEEVPPNEEMMQLFQEIRNL